MSILKIDLKKQAIVLRKQGLSYTEVLKQVPVAKSTLSLWLRGVGLAKKQKQRLIQKRLNASIRGGQAKKDERLKITAEIHKAAELEIGSMTDRDLMILGTALYWAEGSKERKKSQSCGLIFSNSDPEMIRIFLQWLFCILKVKKQEIRFEIYLHDNNIHRVREVQEKWASVCEYPLENFQTIYFKKNKIKTKRTNIGNLYYGQLRVKVNASSGLYRRVDGWRISLCKNIWGIV